MTAALAIYQRNGALPFDGRPAAVRNLFKRGEVLTICRTVLATEPDGMTTRDLAVACLAAREFDHEDPVLVRAMVGLLSNTLKKAVRRREMVKADLAGRKAAWRLIDRPWNSKKHSNRFALSPVSAARPRDILPSVSGKTADREEK